MFTRLDTPVSQGVALFADESSFPIIIDRSFVSPCIYRVTPCRKNSRAYHPVCILTSDCLQAACAFLQAIPVGSPRCEDNAHRHPVKHMAYQYVRVGYLLGAYAINGPAITPSWRFNVSLARVTRANTLDEARRVKGYVVALSSRSPRRFPPLQILLSRCVSSAPRTRRELSLVEL